MRVSNNKSDMNYGKTQSENPSPTSSHKSGSIPPYPVFVVGIIAFSQMFSIGVLAFVVSQYGYLRFRQILFPNATVSNNGGSSCAAVNTSAEDVAMEKIVQKHAAQWSVYNALSLAPILVTAPILSSLSDTFGRKYLMLLPLIGSFFKSTMFTLTMYFDWNIYLVPLWNGLESFSGSWLVSVALACSYAADMTTSGKDRSIAIAVVELFIGCGFVVATFSSGYMIKAEGFILPVVVALCITAVCVGILILLVPESLERERRVQEFKMWRQIKTFAEFYFRQNVKGCTGKRWMYIVCIAAFSCVSLGTLGRTNIEILYQLGSPFCWTSVDISNWGTYRTVIQQILGIIMIKTLQRFMTDEMIAIAGFISAVAYFIAEGLASNTVELYIVPIVGCMGIVEIAMIRSIMSKMTSTDKQGALFAGIALFETLFVMAGASASSAVYSSTVSFYRGSAFFIMAAFNALGLALVIPLYVKGRGKAQTVIEVIIPPSESTVSTKL